MFTRLLSTICGAGIGFAVVAAPARAADDIATKAQECGVCHGAGGTPVDPKTTPIIWGQQSSYLYKELQNYHSGERKSPVMQPVVHDFSLADLRALADYFAAKPWPAGHPANPPPAIPEKAVMCRACHGQNFEGGPPAPRLAGLSYEYLAGTMRSFATDERTNNGDMSKFMHALTDSERDTIARYLAAQ